MISSMLSLFTIIIATESSAGQVAFSELTLASNPSVGVGLTTQLVADAFTLLDLDGNQELSVDEMAPVVLPLMKLFAGQFVDDSGAYVLQEKFVNHLYVPDLSAISGSVGDSTCAADSMLVNLDSSTLWSEVFGDAAHVEIETFAETVYTITAEDQVFTLLDLERLMIADLPTETPSATLLDEYTVGNENCANSDEGRRNLFYGIVNRMNSCWGRLARFGFVTSFFSGAGCLIESQMGDDCAHSWVSVGRGVGVGLGLGGLQEGIPYLMQRYSLWPFIACPVYEVPLEPVIYGVPRSPIVLTPNGGPGGPGDIIDPADFEMPDMIEGAPEIGEIATASGEVAAVGVAGAAAETAGAAGAAAGAAEAGVAAAGAAEAAAAGLTAGEVLLAGLGGLASFGG